MLLVTQLLIGSAIGLVITTTGVGGGVILLPVLIYLFGMNALAAVATANLLSMLMKISSSYIHFRDHVSGHIFSQLWGNLVGLTTSIL